MIDVGTSTTLPSPYPRCPPSLPERSLPCREGPLSKPTWDHASQLAVRRQLPRVFPCPCLMLRQRRRLGTVTREGNLLLLFRFVEERGPSSVCSSSGMCVTERSSMVPRLSRIFVFDAILRVCQKRERSRVSELFLNMVLAAEAIAALQPRIEWWSSIGWSGAE